LQNSTYKLKNEEVEHREKPRGKGKTKETVRQGRQVNSVYRVLESGRKKEAELAQSRRNPQKKETQKYPESRND